MVIPWKPTQNGSLRSVTGNEVQGHGRSGQTYSAKYVNHLIRSILFLLLGMLRGCTLFHSFSFADPEWKLSSQLRDNFLFSAVSNHSVRCWDIPFPTLDSNSTRKTALDIYGMNGKDDRVIYWINRPYVFGCFWRTPTCLLGLHPAELVYASGQKSFMLPIYSPTEANSNFYRSHAFQLKSQKTEVKLIMVDATRSR
ncbi:hypothetical protein KP509_05G007000 [Ceratopteris richardii]|uniref:Uncharacterized protein n=1 Tax=Ceratopteris richardii TaxID=49495 RepID=A0A8T2US23_CERRI|nr:hypothetical protein KP509_05G007000 [Ceratopteris richardii]